MSIYVRIQLIIRIRLDSVWLIVSPAMQIQLRNIVLLFVRIIAMVIIVLILVSKLVLLSIRFRLMHKMAIIYACSIACLFFVPMPTHTLNAVSESVPLAKASSPSQTHVPV